MPFVQRVVQPIQLAQAAPYNSTASASGKAHSTASKFQCIPGKCKNNNCINKQQQQQQQERKLIAERTESTRAEEGGNASERVGGGDDEFVSRTTTTATTIVKDKQLPLQQQQQPATSVTTALIHGAALQNGDAATITTNTTRSPHDISADHTHNHTNGFASSFSYATDVDEDIAGTSSLNTTVPLPMKKLKQHVEFLSSSGTPLSPTRSVARRGSDSPQLQPQTHAQTRRSVAVQSPIAAKIIPGYEFDSISNITLSNALRQLASLVLIASDIFDELQRELQCVGDRARIVQRKIVAVERRVCAYDPKMVTVPESDLLTFAQRKTHYETDKSLRKELFTAETRPRSVRVLYDDAAKVSAPPPPSVASSSHSPASFTSDGCGDISSDTGATTAAAGSDELVCTPVFGKANRKMRTRIDAEIEIRLPAAIEDLRKWTSTEALGDVTVTPDCMHHVETSISTSFVIGDSGVLTPALSPSVLSADAVDALYSINVNNAVDNTIIQLPSDINKDVPLNHRLPSPEEQCKIIALRYPAEVISVDTSGKRFQRMCMARKSTTGCFTNIAEANNLNEDVQTVSRRSRSRKVRGKRRNTIAGIDQKEILDAANGDSTATSGEIKNTLAAANSAVDEETLRRSTDKSKKFGRSKSSDILKKESVALPYDKGKSTLTRLNSLKQWGRNRFKFMQRADAPTQANGSFVGGFGVAGYHDSSGSSPNTSIEKPEIGLIGGGGGGGGGGVIIAVSSTKASTGAGSGDIDDECVVHELIGQKSEGRFSHERKPSYSSSEKSMSVSSSGHLKGKLHLATCGGVNVKLRDTSSLNRQRRNGISAHGLGGKVDEQPHSSSGNWSASSESGRASIGSEITIQPKSSASNTSLNVSSFHPGSGPPSSMMSRRRFLNTSASSSVTSEGTATPDLQVATDGVYPNHLDDETSSAYSCDTEGYYTSFHMDSGLRTLKEEEPNTITTLQNSQNLHTSNYSFGSQSNQTVLTAENEYELFGRGSTSTTTSSAGTVCTTLMINNGEQSSLNGMGPDVPERISSLGKLNKSNHSNSASTSTLERSYSSSTIGSTLERTGTIKRNVNAGNGGGLKLTTTESENIDEFRNDTTETPESQEDEFDFEQRIHKRTAQPLPITAASIALTNADVEYSESSDLEGVERIERIKQKTAINAKRIPSMCHITPTTSDDENQSKDLPDDDENDNDDEDAFDPNKTLTNKSSSPSSTTDTVQCLASETAIYSTVDSNGPRVMLVTEAPLTPKRSGAANDKDHNLNVLKRNSNYGFNNMLEKLKVVLPNIKRSPSKSSQQYVTAASSVAADELYDAAGEYVTIADISNNNRGNQLQAPKSVGASSLGIYYSNDIVRRKLESSESTAVTAKGNEPRPKRETTEYVSLNELPYHLRKIGSSSAAAASATFGANNESPSSHRRYTHSDDDGREQRKAAHECAESVSQQQQQCDSTSMYAEIGELREQQSSSLISPLSAAVQNKGARVRLNAQGKIIYDSDSLKRRKGAHTTFAPGPYVKETESALPEITIATAAVSESALGSSKIGNFTTQSTAARLLLLNGGVAATRKIANVRPIVATTPLSQTQRTPTTTHNNNMSYTPPSGQCLDAIQPYSYQDAKNLLANNTNPFFQSSTTGSTMMPSPSTKSTSSTGSTISSTTSTNTSSGGVSSTTISSGASKEEGYQRLYKSNDHQLQPQQKQQHQTMHMHHQHPTTKEAQEEENDVTSFQRNTPVYWTLQNNRRQTRNQPSSATCRDDLYATPIRRSERPAAAAAAARAAAASQSNGATISPIVPRLRSGFLTSTPTKDSQLPADNIPAKQPSTRHAHCDDNSPERLNTCADRIGQSKTSLMDFKRLLLAKSTKNSPVQRKVSAVELLKPTVGAATAAPTTTTAAAQSATASLNSSLKLLDLSGSPKTFANRRMLRQGQFGSPSKSFAPKIKSAPLSGGVALRGVGAVQRTDIMSTTIPEVNSEEDQSNTSGSSAGSTSSKPASECGDTPLTPSASARAFDLKRNFFMQTEENNFMRGESKHASFGSNNRGSGAMSPAMAGSKYVSAPAIVGVVVTPVKAKLTKPLIVDAGSYAAAPMSPQTSVAAAKAALETAL